jgi:hypothetical protein
VQQAGLFLVAADVVVLRAHETGRVAVTLALAATALGARLFGALTAFGARELSSGIWLHDWVEVAVRNEKKDKAAVWENRARLFEWA